MSESFPGTLGSGQQSIRGTDLFTYPLESGVLGAAGGEIGVGYETAERLAFSTILKI